MTYWILSLALVAFGVVGALSIGRPFLLIGLTMLLLGPWRHRSAIFWPPLFAMIAYDVVFWATVPFPCTTTQSVGEGSAGEASTTVCSNLLGTTWSGHGVFNPSLEPADQAGVVAAGLAFVAGLVMVRRLNAIRRHEGT